MIVTRTNRWTRAVAARAAAACETRSDARQPVSTRSPETRPIRAALALTTALTGVTGCEGLFNPPASSLPASFFVSWNVLPAERSATVRQADRFHLTVARTNSLLYDSIVPFPLGLSEARVRITLDLEQETEELAVAVQMLEGADTVGTAQQNVTLRRGEVTVANLTIVAKPPAGPGFRLTGAETIFNFDFSSRVPAPPYTNIQFSGVFEASDAVSGSDVFLTNVYGALDGINLLQTRNDTPILTNGGTVYGPLLTANPIFDPMLDGVFSFGLLMTSGTATLQSLTACGVNQGTVGPCITINRP